MIKICLIKFSKINREKEKAHNTHTQKKKG